jgi:DNA invertase Pin-like site-specific DNA recombinase
LLKKRVKAGLARARAQGKILGRPKVTKKVEQSIYRLRKAGIGKRKISKQFGIGVSTVMRVLKEPQAA